MTKALQWILSDSKNLDIPSRSSSTGTRNFRSWDKSEPEFAPYKKGLLNSLDNRSLPYKKQLPRTPISRNQRKFPHKLVPSSKTRRAFFNSCIFIQSINYKLNFMQKYSEYMNLQSIFMKINIFKITGISTHCIQKLIKPWWQVSTLFSSCHFQMPRIRIIYPVIKVVISSLYFIFPYWI